ncbi:MAG: extracellular solute-binding protein, partial [Chloroflexi bacterium]|nr:extracellular solute-binding protein [Chloroflexota bacterium]
DLSGVAFNAQPAYDAYALVERLVKGNYAYQSKGYDYQADFGNKKVAMFFGSSTGRPFVKGALTDKDTKKEKFKWGITMIPQGDPAKLVTVMYGANITVFKTTPAKQAAAWEFIKWFTDTPQSVKWSITSSYMPIRKSAAENADLKKAWETDIQGKQAFDMIQYSRPEPNVRGWQDARTFLEDALQSVISGKATPKDAVDTAAAKTNKAIEEAK